ncbi:unnamed protein product [Orchesella dallaii]|uniref:Uncharacterized protein n=1 Tax=Orchesella dallaii TaxID=48710 RepID=A0ABP1RHD1_9HEXA
MTNMKTEYEKERFRGEALKNFLETNARLVTKQKLSTKEILLISDSIFPSINNNFVLHSKFMFNLNQPIKFPTAILTYIKDISGITSENANVLSYISRTPIMFINLSDFSLGLGCFTCEYSDNNDWIVGQYFRITFQKPPETAYSSFHQLMTFWKMLHSTLNIKAAKKPESCSFHIQHEVGFNLGLCETYEEYFKYINCSNVLTCINIHLSYLELRRGTMTFDRFMFRYDAEILHFGVEQIEYTVQMIFPKVQFFDANLTAFLTPFRLNIWISTLVAIAGLLIWLVLIDGNNLLDSFFIIYSILVSQDANQKTSKRLAGTILIITWVFSSFLLREAYNSSLYSFMTSKQKHENFPQDMAELLSRNDFDLILPISFRDEIIFSFFIQDTSKLSKSLATFYLKILTRAYFMTRGFYQQTLENISNGNPSQMWHYPSTTWQNYIDWLDIELEPKMEIVTTKKFAVVCIRHCAVKWNIALIGKPGLSCIKPKQNAFFTTNEFWTLSYPIFSTFTISKFLGPFVESGIYEWQMHRQRVVEQVKLLKSADNLKNLIIATNYSMVDFVLHGSKKKNPVHTEEATPTKISALTGTLMLTGFMMLAYEFGNVPIITSLKGLLFASAMSILYLVKGKVTQRASNIAELFNLFMQFEQRHLIGTFKYLSI